MQSHNNDVKLNSLMFLALDHGINSVREGGPLIPFVMSEVDGKRSINRFMVDTLEASLEKANEFIANFDPIPDYFALAYDGIVTIEGERFDAIMVKAFGKSEKQGFLIAQRYKPKSKSEDFSTIGNPAFMGNEPNPIFKK